MILNKESTWREH